jgi:hypothetical protein
MTAVRLGPSQRVVLDGRVDEELWQLAKPATDFVQIDPVNGSPATERTEVRIVYDTDTL